ncbi:aminotransferase class I/II-fold pyridoxal phosphate-dependent enzyme [Butyricicoccus faecihominis]|uniref:pyridoxal phosphate-dependent aminotransferase n=1 Tax=Butyricicoccus faecihominis TaxID=1712515 RepID=UPI00247AC173|nr:histidinol-phosphate transaminase [Butyricicoccus faecihominis]MCQ5129646.1 aminotransferase class I/II-fold pyridoxal phosphate-dependent enzyme [Butyricicoccus faecihominis]
MQYQHGGDVYSYAEGHGGALPTDLSANINPYGPPESVLAALHDAVAFCGRYPDPYCRAARRAVGAREGIDPAWIYPGNGAADVLDRLALVLRPKTALLLAPTFAEYERALGACETRFHALREDEGFALTERILTDLSPAPDAVFLCNPNNPTGRAADPALMRKIAAVCEKNDIWLIVDECFSDFLTDEARHTLKDLLPRHQKLVLLRAYTKMYAVPGVRFGWCMTANRDLIEALYQAGQPWNVSVFAQACAVAAAGEAAFARDSAQRIAAERAFLRTELGARGLWVCPGEANYLLFRAHDESLAEKLAARGVLVRDCSNYRGLARGYYRTAVRGRAESAALLAALDTLNEGGMDGWQKRS